MKTMKCDLDDKKCRNGLFKKAIHNAGLNELREYKEELRKEIKWAIEEHEHLGSHN